MVPGVEIFKESSEVSFLLAWAWVVLVGQPLCVVTI
jgi:hypothetical protein